MAHKYSNFADAFDSLKTRTSNWYTEYGMIATMCGEARGYAAGKECQLAVYKLAQVIQYFADTYDRLIDLYFDDADSSDLFESLYWASQEGGNGAIDMTTILDAMWKAEPHQCLLFIPMIDAMRGSIQNKTVTTDWMSQALRHFM
ncbi:unnamed protein product [marine sediment metagenome]|uniref:Uncharacterized protein n=1 Tax=marine sediment metagenome TaxID=412755 RepID=X1FAT7_9ZZZZ